MVEKFCNLWAEPAKYRCIPTDGTVSKGEAVLNSEITSRGNHVQIIRPEIVAFPIKQYEFQDIVLEIVKRSAQELIELVGNNVTLLPRFLSKEHTAYQEIENLLISLPDNIIVVKTSM